MVGKNKGRVILTLKQLTIDMLETISITTGLTKSQIMQQLLFNYTLSYWSDPESKNERWKKYKENKDEKK